MQWRRDGIIDSRWYHWCCEAQGGVAVKQYITTMTQRGQVTVPVEVQRLLGIGPRDKVAFMVENQEVRIVPGRDLLSGVLGSVKRLDPDDQTSIEDLIDEARGERAEHVEAKWRAE
jgi:bifunctional DNA-binding transcriptional regulator/antitoxin component of YhaV-PrlF toxin-antitoxin module